MNKISISEVLSQAWELTKKNWISILAALLIIWVVKQIIASMFGPSVGDIQPMIEKMSSGKADPAEIMAYYNSILAASGPGSFISNLIEIILMAGLYRLVLNAVQGHGEFTINAWKLPVNTYVKYVVVIFIVSIIFMIGLVFCILPGIYLLARLQFASLFILEHEEAGIGDAISASWNMTKDDALTLCLLLLVFLLMIFAGLLCCCVGVVLSEIIIYLATGVAFYTLLPKKLEDATPSEEVAE